MAFIGYSRDGTPVFEFIGDVPDFYVTQGRKFGLVHNNLGFTPNVGTGYAVSSASPTLFTFIIVATIIAILVALAIVFLIEFQQVIASFQGCQSRSIDPNHYQDCNGCIWEFQAATGTWAKIGGCLALNFGPLTGLLLAGGALIAVGAAAYVGLGYYRKRATAPVRRRPVN